MIDYKRIIIAVRGDTQAGHDGGLLNPETLFPVLEIDEEKQQVCVGFEKAHLNPVQRQLWKWAEEDRGKIRDLAGQDEIVFLEMGDMTQGVRFTDNLQLASLDRQTIAALWNAVPWLAMDQVHTMRAVKGTGVHVWGDGSTETILTMLLSREFPGKDIKIASHYILNVNGFRLDVAHHGPGPGIRNWTRSNMFDLYLKSLLMDDLNSDRTPPSIALRGHKHEFTKGLGKHQVRGQVWELPGFIVPPYCFIGDHAQKVGNSPSSMGVGTLALEVIDGELYKWHPFTHYVDLRTEEVIHGYIDGSTAGGGVPGSIAEDHRIGGGESGTTAAGRDGPDHGSGDRPVPFIGSASAQAPKNLDGEGVGQADPGVLG